MEQIWMRSWPREVPKELTFRLGKKPLYEYLRDNARKMGQETAIIFYGRRISYFELNELSENLACFLQQLGVSKGDRVALYMQNCPQYVISFFGAQKAGAVVCPCSPMFKEWELEYELNDSGAETIILLDSLYPVLEKVIAKTKVKNIITTNITDFLPENPDISFPEDMAGTRMRFANTHDLLEICRRSTGSFNPPTYDMDDVGLMIYTSGTTGLPKGAMLTYYNSLFKTVAAVTTARFKKEDVFLSTLPIFHMAGIFIGFNVPIYLGAATVMLARFDPVAVMEAVEKYSCTVWYSLTPMNIAILDSPLKGDYNLSSLKVNLCSSFGIALTEEISRQWKDLTGGCRLFESSYGLSETHGLDTFMLLNRIKFGTVGIPSHECQIKIVDWEAGEDLGVNREGEIVVKNPGVFKGYWKRPEETQKVLKEGWLYTGDVGKMDEEGYLYFYGRKKEMIKCSGYSVFPEEVEMLLLKHPAIAQAAVIGIPDEKRGQTVKAFVVLRPDMKGRYTEQDIIDWSKERMAAYKYPRHVQFLEQLPMSGSGKVLRRLLEDGSITK